MPTVEHWLLLTLLGIIVALALILTTKALRKLNIRRQKRILDISGVDTMDGLVFERYVVKLLKKRGFSAIKMTERYDYGVDIIAYKNGVVWGIQVKRYKGLVKAEAVRQVVTGLKKYRCDRAMVITNSSFSRVARDLATSNDCILIDRSALSGWIG
ncbi:MAG TPA: restriction endonuclease [Candidatus Saccharimonadales bacterium]|nr:restriction endonuclease [Candidatus Saccharimonadales bacterium]